MYFGWTSLSPLCGVHGLNNVMRFGGHLIFDRILKERFLQTRWKASVRSIWTTHMDMCCYKSMCCSRPCLPLNTQFGSHTVHVTQDRQFLPACESGSRWTAQRLCRQSLEGKSNCSFCSHLDRVFYVEGENRAVPYIPRYSTFLPALAQDLIQGEEESSIAIILWDWETSRCLGSFLKPSPLIALHSSSRRGNSVPSGEEIGVGFHLSL